VLAPTPPDQLTDGHGRPYFLWDCDLTLDQFRALLEHPDERLRGYMVAKLMRQAKPDDVFLFVRPRTIRESWPEVNRHLGRSRAFWTWLFNQWEAAGRGWR